ncbi:PocR ligand-binding domain-containing protein [Heliobacterium chlorum]|uniref:PocR ligand-binding domain-containing protein n=1 Tax=Heliobacterium chlorum TaxID=2698 RepID=A0ABR7T1Q1_HELCL|nr:PocR ligand-binding domain-containing protein [Heliobacterium chlorum]MBC9784057.1 PocR ligand-binding domain-containing protein [Heliobacterium chlorum]
MNAAKNATEAVLDISEVKLGDVIDFEFLQRFQDNFATAMGFASLTVDLDGQPVTKPSAFTRFCMELTRNTEKGLRRCAECDRKGGEKATSTGKPSIYECHAGLVDFAVPIMLGGKQIGTVLGGQVLTQPPETEKYEQVAKEIGVDPQAYIEAVKEVKVVSRERIEAAAFVLWDVVNTMTKTWYDQHKLGSIARTLNASITEMSATMEEMAASATDVSNNQIQLNKEIQNVSVLTGKINEVIDFIKEVADETRLLGLNAAIEAAKAGEAGLGFGVVAQEIRKLSGDSKQTVNKIKEFTLEIKNSVAYTVRMGDATSSSTQQQAAAIQEVTATLQDIAGLSDTLENLSSIS